MDEAPDPRYLLANERTLLAYERTESGTAAAPGRPGGSGSGVLCWSVCALTAQP